MPLPLPLLLPLTSTGWLLPLPPPGVLLPLPGHRHSAAMTGLPSARPFLKLMLRCATVLPVQLPLHTRLWSNLAQIWSASVQSEHARRSAIDRRPRFGRNWAKFALRRPKFGRCHPNSARARPTLGTLGRIRAKFGRKRSGRIRTNPTKFVATRAEFGKLCKHWSDSGQVDRVTWADCATNSEKFGPKSANSGQVSRATWAEVGPLSANCWPKSANLGRLLLEAGFLDPTTEVCRSGASFGVNVSFRKCGDLEGSSTIGRWAESIRDAVAGLPEAKEK